MQREYYFDYIKIALSLVVIYAHALIPYLPSDESLYHVSDPSEIITWGWKLFFYPISFSMALFLFIAGLFAPKSLSKYGAREFIKRKFIRLGVPVVLIVVIYRTFFGYYHVGHLWFNESLFIFLCVYCLCNYVKGSSCIKIPYVNISLIHILLFGLFISLFTVIVRMFFKLEELKCVWNILYLEPAHYPHYICLFVMGILLSENRFGISKTVGIVSLISSALLIAGVFILSLKFTTWQSIAYRWQFGVYDSFMCVTTCVGYLWFFKEYLNKSNVFLGWCSEQTYCVYIIHLPLLVCIEYLMDEMKFDVPFMKFFVQGTICTIISFVLSWLIRMIPGVKKYI